MFDKVLIANRGEIACRVIGTARRLGMCSVAVYSDADAGARHVALADEAYHIGPPAARESYLLAERILEAAARSGAQAIHPGYGFLSENAEFAEACAAAGLVFVGPPPAAIRALGLKDAAKAIMEKAGVPVVPGYHGADQNPGMLRSVAAEIGYPVLIKAVAGGGGKGMRRVDSDAGFHAALEGAQREAANAFGDDRVLIEKCLVKPRHIEIQVFADGHGGAVHLFERDCSLPRRHQKVVEEAPAPDMDAAMRRAMGEAAVAAAKAIDYRGAGTVEFIVDVSGGMADAPFYFMEMNTRLQVEHPVTEMITGQDLVEWQFRVAAGEPLPCRQNDLVISGHAVEVRIYAEDPGRGFLPSTGTLRRLRLPPAETHVRVDTGVREGDTVTPFYDPMIAKLIVWDRDRASALRQLRGALESTEIVGVASNVSFLRAVAGHHAFGAGDVDTGFIERWSADLVPEVRPADAEILSLACLHVVLRQEKENRRRARASGDPWSPWSHANGWRLNDEARQVLHLRDGEAEVEVVVHYGRDGYRFDLPGGTVEAHGEITTGDGLVAVVDGRRMPATVVRQGRDLTVLCRGHSHRLTLRDPLEAGEDGETEVGALTAPLPGKVIQVAVSQGDTVARGEPLMIVEAMKMEHTIAAPADGVVEKIHFAVGDQVSEGAVLLVLRAPEAD